MEKMVKTPWLPFKNRFCRTNYSLSSIIYFILRLWTYWWKHLKRKAGLFNVSKEPRKATKLINSSESIFLSGKQHQSQARTSWSTLSFAILLRMNGENLWKVYQNLTALVKCLNILNLIHFGNGFFNIRNILFFFN